MMKRITIIVKIFILFLIAFTFNSCGKKSGEDNNKKQGEMKMLETNTTLPGGVKESDPVKIRLTIEQTNTIIASLETIPSASGGIGNIKEILDILKNQIDQNVIELHIRYEIRKCLIDICNPNLPDPIPDASNLVRNLNCSQDSQSLSHKLSFGIDELKQTGNEINSNDLRGIDTYGQLVTLILSKIKK